MEGLYLLVFCCFGVCVGRLGLLLLWVCCGLAGGASSAALGCFGLVLGSSASEGLCGLQGHAEKMMRLKGAPRRLYTNRGSRTKHCQAAPSCHQRQPLTRKVGDRVPKQWLRCVSCWPIKAGVLSSATLAVWRAVLTGELNVKNEPERSISLV